MKDIDLMINPDETILGIRRELEEYIGYEILNFGECRMDLLRIKKREK